MNPTSRPAQAAPGVLPPVRPSLLVRVAVRPMTRVLNPLMVKITDRRQLSMAAQLRHVGRRSGNVYVTPVGAKVSGDVAVIPLTFGNQSDWAKNVRAAGGCSIRANGQDYQASDPEFLDRRAAGPLLASLFNPVARAGFRMLGIKQYLRLHVTPAGAPAG
jgi:deazaflavin-dependent oxidoreductase (nitroreductase family)